MRPVTFVRASSGYVAENEVEEAGVVERLGRIYWGSVAESMARIRGGASFHFRLFLLPLVALLVQ